MRLNLLRLDYFCRWRVIKSLFIPSVTRLLTSYFCLVPFVVAVFGNLPDRVVLGEYEIYPRLPFSWEIFYIGSVLYSISFIIYIWKCPDFIRRFGVLADFRNSASNKEEIFTWLVRLMRLCAKHESMHSQTDHLFHTGYFEPVTLDELIEIEERTDSPTLLRNIVIFKSPDGNSSRYILDVVDLPPVYSGPVVLRISKVATEQEYDGKIFEACMRGFERHAPYFRYICILNLLTAYFLVISMLFMAIVDTLRFIFS